MPPKKHDTLCWECEKACGKCSWSKNFTPVEGWNAVPTKLLLGSVRLASGEMKEYIADTFDVYECPEFELMEAIKEQKVAKAGQIRHIEGKSIVNSLLRRKYNQVKKERERE